MNATQTKFSNYPVLAKTDQSEGLAFKFIMRPFLSTSEANNSQNRLVACDMGIKENEAVTQKVTLSQSSTSMS